MLRKCFVLLSVIAFGEFASDRTLARGRAFLESNGSAPLVDGSPTLAPFQHVRFCLRYPADCKSVAQEAERIELTAVNSLLLNRVNREVNVAIAPKVKGYGVDLHDGWTIAPVFGDCNDYAVTKRHTLIENGLPAKAIRLSVVKTVSGIGHLVLVVITTKGDLVLDNLNEAIRPWHVTDYRWLKIQSTSDARLWNEVQEPGTRVSRIGQSLSMAGRE